MQMNVLRESPHEKWSDDHPQCFVAQPRNSSITSGPMQCSFSWRQVQMGNTRNPGFYQYRLPSTCRTAYLYLAEPWCFHDGLWVWIVHRSQLHPFQGERLTFLCSISYSVQISTDPKWIVPGFNQPKAKDPPENVLHYLPHGIFPVPTGLKTRENTWF